MRIPISSLLALALLAACEAQGDTPPDPPKTPDATPPASPSPTDSPLASGARSVVEQTDDYLFEYSYPAEAGNIPELAALLDRRLENTRADLARNAARDREQARDNGFPFNKYSNEVVWEVVADLPDWLSLSAGLHSYTGGAHGNYGFAALVWDKKQAKAIEPLAFFASADALDEAIGDRLCADINAERAKRRGEPVPEGSDDTFDKCVGVEETTVLLGSAGGKKVDRIGIQIGPYVAGPYAEGSFEFDYRVDRAIMDAVKPEFREAFATRN